VIRKDTAMEHELTPTKSISINEFREMEERFCIRLDRAARSRINSLFKRLQPNPWLDREYLTKCKTASSEIVDCVERIEDLIALIDDQYADDFSVDLKEIKQYYQRWAGIGRGRPRQYTLLLALEDLEIIYLRAGGRSSAVTKRIDVDKDVRSSEFITFVLMVFECVGIKYPEQALLSF
jgi:hypothetical protein